ncbi:MAG: DUF4097 family beta strand repeat-containing protein [Acutalibacteraceae bacterium]
MTTAQKIIKYFAIAFAIFLIVSIFSGIIGAVSGLSFVFGSKDAAGEMQTYAIDGDVNKLEIDLSGAQLEIRTGTDFSVESNHKYLSVESKDGTLTLKEDTVVGGFNYQEIKVILTVPESKIFDKADISAGAGTVRIDELTADKLCLDLGAGKTDIGKLSALSSSRINGGAGELNIGGGELANLDFDMGVGKVSIVSRLNGDCEADCGVGDLSLTLIGTRDDYRIDLDKGVGEAVVGGERASDGAVFGNGVNSVDVDGGVGRIEIKFEENA